MYNHVNVKITYKCIKLDKAVSANEFIRKTFSRIIVLFFPVFETGAHHVFQVDLKVSSFCFIQQHVSITGMFSMLVL